MVMPWGQRGCTNGHCLFYYSKLKRAVLRVDKANGVVLEPEQLGRQGVACGKPNITGSVRNWKCTVSHQHGGGFGQARESAAAGSGKTWCVSLPSLTLIPNSKPLWGPCALVLWGPPCPGYGAPVPWWYGAPVPLWYGAPVP